MALLVLLGIATPMPSHAAPAVPERVGRDAGAGNSPGISAFELYRQGLYWWKDGASISEVIQREGTLALKPSLGLLSSSYLLAGPSTRYLGRGYDFRINGAARDDQFVYYAANGYLRKAPLSSTPASILGDDTRILVEQIRPPFGLDFVPVAANGAVLLWNGALWYSHSDGGSFVVRRPSGLAGLSTFSAAGDTVTRLLVTPVLSEDGNRLKDVLLVLTRSGLLYRFDFDPFNAAPTLLARGVWDFAVRQESFLRVSGGIFGFRRAYSTAIYAAVGDLSSDRQTGRLLHISARDGSTAVEYDTGSRELQVRGVAVDDQRIYLTVTPLSCGGFGCLYDSPNSQVLRRVAPAHSDLAVIGNYQTIADRFSAGGSLEGYNLRSDGRWVYWISGDNVWRIPGDAEAIERDFEATGIEVVQTTQDLDNTTRLVAGKPAVVRAYARVTRDSLGAAGHRLSAGLQVYHDGVPLAASPLRPVNAPLITGATDLSNLRTNLNASFLFELPTEWVQRGQLRAEVTVNPSLTIPETGPNPLGNNTLSSAPLQVIQMGSPCLVFVPIHTGAPNYDPLAPGSGFADILARAQSMLPISNFRFVIKGDRISKPVPKIKFKEVLGVPIPYPAIDYQSFVTEDGFSGALFWLKVYSTFERDPRDCDDTHYVGTVHWMANTSKDGSTALGLATRPSTGVAEDLVVKMEPPGAVMNNPVWMEPRGGETLAHELSHNYTVRHIDQTSSPLMCGGGKPDGAGGYPCDTCTIGIINAANLNTELQSRTTQYGFDPLTWTPIAPNAAADIMTYRSSKWLSKHTLDLLFGRIPGFQAGSPQLAGPAAPPLPEKVLLLNGTLDLANSTAVLWPCYRLPASALDSRKILASLAAEPAAQDWVVRLLGANGDVLAQYPLQWERQDDGERSQTSFVQFLPDQPDAARLQVLRGDRLVAECQPSRTPPEVEVRSVEVDANAGRLHAEWRAADADGDLLSFVLQCSPDDGATWRTLQAGYPDQSYSTSLRFLCGGERNRFRVIATDGFHSNIAESKPFAIPRHGPEVALGGIIEGEHLPFGSTRLAHAVAYDAEDASLDPSAIRWQLSGSEERSGSGASFLLQDLAPGNYVLSAAATDTDGNEGRQSVSFTVLPLEIAEATEPVLDGECNDPAYAQAPLIRVPLGGGDYALAKMVHAAGALWVCVTELAYSGDSGPPANIGIRTDLSAGYDRKPIPEDLVGFFVDEAGIPFTLADEKPSVAGIGFTVAISRGERRWSAEMRIADALLGGWNREVPVFLSHFATTLPGPSPAWPPGAAVGQPATWSAGSFGPLPPPSDQAPFAIVSPSRSFVARPGERVSLDGSRSFDPDGDPLTFLWTQTDGAPVALDDPASPIPTFVLSPTDTVGTRRFRLVVQANGRDSEPAEVTVTLTPSLPGPEPGSGIAGPAGRDPAGPWSFQLFWPGQPGDRCLIQGSADLAAWEDLDTALADYRGLIPFTVPTSPAFPWRFFRAVSAPVSGGDGDPRNWALQFNGAGPFVEVTHHPDLNAYPLTLAFRLNTTDVGATARGLATKYSDSAFNGYALFLSEGRIRGWYFGTVGTGIWDGALGFDSGFIADGTWHQVALVVDDQGGHLYLDGTVRSSIPWTGTPGPAVSTLPLQLGRYSTYAESYAGLLDDVAIWNRALTPEEILGLQSLPPNPNDVGLVAYWPFVEGAGEATSDASGNGHDGTLREAPAWVEVESP